MMHAWSAQAFAGFYWSKQFYHYVVASQWLKGDPAMPSASAGAEIRTESKLDHLTTTT